MTSLDTVLSAARDLHANHPDLQVYAPWPDDVEPADLPARAIPATDIVARGIAQGSDMTRPLADAISASAGLASWKRTYTEEEVGADFLSRYGYYELFGPTGHYHTTALRGYIGYWGNGLHYDWHSHEAEELYLCLSGEAEFHRSDNSLMVRPGETRAHESWQSHAMTTYDQPILTLVLWRGPGLAGLPRMD